MPRRIGELTETGIIAEMRAEIRRLLRGTAAIQSPLGEYDEYTLTSSIDSAHTLTYIPSLSLIPIACLNGLPGRYGTDYTVDFTTGIVTWSATKVTGDILSVFYQTTGDLVALSGPADFGWVVSDNFNRADSTGPSSTINPASDGGTWTEDFGFGASWGVLSNHGLMTNAAPGSGYGVPWIARDVGSNSAHVEVTWTRDSATVTDISGSVYVWLAFDPVIHSGYLMFVNLTTWGIASFDGATGTTLSTTTWSLTYDVPRSLVFTYSSSGLLTATLGGGTPQTVTDSTYLTSSANTYVGLGANRSYDLFDNFLARPGA